MSLLTSPLLAQIEGLAHGFGTRATPAPSHWNTWEQRPRHRQIHTAAVARAEYLGQELGECDALWTQARDVPIAVVSADCVPLLIASGDASFCAAIHSGWRGTKAGVLFSLLDRVPSSVPISSLVVAVGPHIRACCYEVSPALAQDFQNQFGAEVVQGARNLSLTTCIANQLRLRGLSHVDFVGGCTRCTPGPEFHSYRREGGGTRQWSALMLKDARQSCEAN